jgi:hypothetical protein
MADGSQLSAGANVRIRLGTTEDVDDLMKIAAEACAENGFLRPNPLKLLQAVWAAVNLQGSMVGIVGPEDSVAIEGVVLLCIGPQWYSDDPVVEERVVWVDPAFRSAKGGRARRLCRFSKQTADELGIPLIIGVLSNKRTQAKVRMYQREFGEPAGAFFLYGAHTGIEA